MEDTAIIARTALDAQMDGVARIAQGMTARTADKVFRLARELALELEEIETEARSRLAGMGFP